MYTGFTELLSTIDDSILSKLAQKLHAECYVILHACIILPYLKPMLTLALFPGYPQATKTGAIA